jgi:TRAP-type C4-dicarboxylate transport system permease small subunit
MASGVGGHPADQAPAGGIWGRFYEGLGYLAGLILAIMAGAVFLQVMLRYIGWAGIDGLDEVPRYLFVWLVMLGAAAAMHRGEHTLLSYFRDRFGRRGRALAIIVANAAGIALFVYFIKLSFILVPNAHLQTSAGLGLPLGYVYAAVPVGAALIILPMARVLFYALRDLWPRPYS